jgi:uncharacterized protein
MSERRNLLSDYPALSEVVTSLNKYLERKHPNVFGLRACHPRLPVKRSKVIHDNLWGTAKFSWRELALIDSPLMQRLRDVHQTGLAYHVYPSSRHSRFEHSLGAATISSRVFDALAHKQRNELYDIHQVVSPDTDKEEFILRIRQELRLAALLHDTGHSLFSHTSERVYADLIPLQKASAELTSFVGKAKGAGEVISFCLALTPAVERLLQRASANLIGDRAFDDYNGAVDLANVALFIVGRSRHPYLQFLGDIVSSGFDADKLDYLLRDATAAGLPLKYDIDRYLYDVKMRPEVLADGDGRLERLYAKTLDRAPERKPAGGGVGFQHYETYRLRLSRRAMNVIEQIVICKMMLYSYIYHHPKVRASEGMLEHLLKRALEDWRSKHQDDGEIMLRFMDMTDASLAQIGTERGADAIVKDYRYRLINRLLPREVYSIGSPSATHAASQMVKDFLLLLHDRKKAKKAIADLETAIGEELIAADSNLGATPREALARAGVWVDAPSSPKFEDIDAIVGGLKSVHAGVPIAQVFPIREWTEAYEHYRYQVRIFAFSEYLDLTKQAAKVAMQRVLGIHSDGFYAGISHDRA